MTRKRDADVTARDSASGKSAARAENIADPFSDESQWMSESIAQTSFDDVEKATGDARNAAIAILNAKSVLHAAFKQRQIAAELARQNDKTANRLFWATVALVVATVVLAATTVATPILEHHFNKPEPIHVTITQVPAPKR